MTTTKDILRRCIFRPYRKGMGPIFRLTTWDTHQPRHGGPQWQIGYRLAMHTPHPSGKGYMHPWTVFEGEDFGCSPMHGIDSDECVRGIMAFLTLRPGDTDSEYFADYTPEQLDYCYQHAEALACEVSARFGDD